ncbi:MAG TPA: hypothetical protein VI758_11045 [Bacteroidota bacterium]
MNQKVNKNQARKAVSFEREKDNRHLISASINGDGHIYTDERLDQQGYSTQSVHPTNESG